MIISASRRTDIPALYPEWFMNRLVEGEVLVPNPYNRKKVSRIELSPETVDCFVHFCKSHSNYSLFVFRNCTDWRLNKCNF